MKQRDVLRPVLIGAAVGLFAALAFAAGILQSLSNAAEDRLVQPHAADPSIAIIAIDDTSLGQIGRWPWPRKIHADLISKLKAAGVTAIGYDVNFSEPSDAEDDTALEQAIMDAGNVVLPIELTLTTGRNAITFNPKTVVSPLPVFAAGAAATGHTNTPPDVDGIVRRVPLSVQAPDATKIMAFSAQVLAHVHPEYPFVEAVSDALSRVMVHYAGAPRTSFMTVSAVDVLRGTADLSKLNGKVVFVGSTAADLHDDQLVPTSGGVPMPGVEIHASLYDTLLQRDWLRPVPFVVSALLLILLGALLGLAIAFLRARSSALVALTVEVVILGSAFALFDRGWLFDIIWPTLTVIGAYAAVTLERRLVADRERRQLKDAFSRYVSASVVSSIMKDPSKLKLGGEKRNMTVLFSDVRGFTTISESLTPERLVDVMNMYLSRMTGIVFAHDGVLDKYIGDAVMAFWNAPFDQKDHAVRAVMTALEMQKALAEMNAKKAFPNGLQLHIGVGINSGDMIVGNMGSEIRFDYTVLGDNVNLGSRLEGITKEYGVGIVMSESSRREVGEKVVVRKLDRVAVKGKKEPVVIYEVLGMSESASPAQRELVKSFEGALEKYFARDFDGALAACDAILKQYPDDGPSKTLRERARHFIEAAPASDWDGTWVMTKK